MKNTTKHLILCLLLVSLTYSLAQANAPRLEVVKKGPKTEEKINKLLLIVLVRTKENRITLEDELGYDLGDYGISTVSSYKTRLVGSDRLNKDEVLAVCHKHGADGVLVVRLVDSKEENGYSYNQRSQYTGAGFTSANSSGVVIGGGQTYSWGDYEFGNYFDAVSSTRMEIQSDIYHINEAKQLMTDDILMRVDPREEEEAIAKFAKKLSKKVSKQKFIVKD
ncbi:hypothetical protein N7E81_13275 [Reichenbachiella carrageenanivorans]|uniref:DUF4136 domain-containing protein n=1 Tax=Reichenbachiella carrageenanivorans TaxID=2979869 RepID=A0ABY6CZS9_9BACT|nr:hypothetical protein [Reichenbachiella carrageenanivorans]UXX78328.1 hypothetical protein N7E81_13275 [Reichenbachiella carrageenanivorans]